jgi:hypothetical protein
MRYLCGLHDYALHNIAIRASLEVQAVSGQPLVELRSRIHLDAD